MGRGCPYSKGDSHTASISSLCSGDTVRRFTKWDSRAEQGTRVGSVVSTQMSEKQVKRTGGLNADIRGFAPDGTRIIRNSSSSRTARICAELRRAARARSCDEPGRSPFSIEHEKRTAPVSYRRAHFDHP